MLAKDVESAGPEPAAVAQAVARTAEAPDQRLAEAARNGRLSAAGALRLQRMAGNRAVAKVLAREDKDVRAMQDASHKPDERLSNNTGQDFVWDPFDRTLTIFTSTGPNAGGAIQLVYKEGTADELAAMPYSGVESGMELSPVRAQVLEFLRVNQGTYQESADPDKIKARAATGATMCNAFVSAVTSNLHKFTAVGGMSPRDEAIKAGRGGAYHTLEDRPGGPKPGDVVAYGAVNAPAKPGGLRRANFQVVKHVGIFKSRRMGPNGSVIWTVVDGGQGKLASRQEVRERTRTFTLEELEVQIPSRFTDHEIRDKQNHLIATAGSAIGYEAQTVKMTCGVLKSKYADAGQNADDKLLRGWLDIDEFYGGGPPPAVTGANSKVFVGNDPETSGAAKAGAVAK